MADQKDVLGMIGNGNIFGIEVEIASFEGKTLFQEEAFSLFHQRQQVGTRESEWYGEHMI